MTPEERLVRVSSHAELRPGMLLVLHGCRHHEGQAPTHRFMLLRSEMTSNFHVNDGSTCGAGYGAWRVVPTPAGHCRGGNLWCFCTCMAEGRLFRVEDGVDAEEQRREGRLLERMPPKPVRAGAGL